MDYIDLRSDTVSHPTPQMRQAMAEAEVGDDVYGEDPTVNALEAEAAERFGKEAALFVTSGTQGNLIALLAHCERGDEVICGDDSHTFTYEVANMAAVGGIMPHTIPVQPDGTYSLNDVRHAVRTSNIHFPRTRLVMMENTHGGRGGAPIPKAHVDEVAHFAHEQDIGVHIDGARFFNAVTALNTTAAALTEHVDSITFCLSKGLCAPAGSILVGERAFIDKARRMRKMLGGGMRQAGILAAAGRIALNQMTQRLQEDHDTACRLAEGLSQIEAVDTNPSAVKTNFVFFELNDQASLSAQELSQHLWDEHHIRISPYHGSAKFRCVTHYWITPERADTVVNAIHQLLD